MQPPPAVPVRSKLPAAGTTIFSVMSALAQQHGAVNLGQGFPDYPIDPALIDLVTAAMRAGHNQYPLMPGVLALREAIAAKVQRLYGRGYDPGNEITVTTGATQAIFTTIQALAHAGDEVIVFEPAYDSYIPSVQLAGATPVPLPLTFPATGSTGTRSAPRSRRGRGSSCSTRPTIPAPACWPPPTSTQLAALVRDTPIVGDRRRGLRAHGLRRRAARKPRAPRRARRAQRRHRLVRQDVPRDRMEGGLRAGARGAHRRDPPRPPVHGVHGQQRGAARRWPRSCRTRRATRRCRQFFQRKRDLFRDLLAGTPLDLLPCAGSYFQLARYGRVSDEPAAAFAERLVVEFGVATIPLSAFHRDGTDHRVIRFCFAKREETLREGAARLAGLRAAR